jgi:predicted RNA-binding protein with RPS1 domain
MSENISQCQHLSENINALLRLFDREPSLKGKYDVAAIKTSREKATNPRFEIVFAGTYSAGKSMLINALLGKDLLHSGTGHVTGRECYIEYAKDPQDEKIEFTFLSQEAIQKEVEDRCKQLKIKSGSINRPESITRIKNESEAIYQANKNTEEAVEAEGLIELLDGFIKHKEYIDKDQYKTYNMTDLKLIDYKSAYQYARRGINSSVLQKIRYYCHHPLLQDGNVLVDLPGIDAPIQRDAQLTYRKVKDTETSAVIFVMQADQEGEIETTEKKLIKAIQENIGISDRVFYVFNRIDITWSKPQLKNELNDLIKKNFNNIKREIHETSALLGFYASCLIGNEDKFWGCKSILEGSAQSENDFIIAFLDYCYSEKIPSDRFEIFLSNKQKKQDQYIDILNRYGDSLLEQVIIDSGIESFKQSITRYLTAEKKPELFKNLINNITHICNDIAEIYTNRFEQVNSKPESLNELMELELVDVNKEVQRLGESIFFFFENESQKLVMDTCENFTKDYGDLHKKLQQKLTKLIENFSILEACDSATKRYESHTVPLVTILGEAFYEIANGLELALVSASEILISNFFEQLRKSLIKNSDYRSLKQLLGHDCEIFTSLQHVELDLTKKAKTIAESECYAFVIESPDLYDHEDSVWLYQFKETLQEASRSKDVKRILEAEPSIRQMLDIDFQNKLDETLSVSFKSKIIKSMKSLLINMAKKKQQVILNQIEQARVNKRKLIEQCAQQKIAQKKIDLKAIKESIKKYNQAVLGINQCLNSMGLSAYILPVVVEEQVNLSTSQNQIQLDNNVVEVTKIDNSRQKNIFSDSDRQDLVTLKPALQRPTLNSQDDLLIDMGMEPEFWIGGLVPCKITELKEIGIIVECKDKKGMIHKSQITGKFINLLDRESHSFLENQQIYAVYLGESDKGISLSTKILENFSGEILEDLDRVMNDAPNRKKEISRRILK